MIIRKIRRYRYIPIHLVHRYPAHIFLPQATCSRQPEQQWQTAASTVPPHDIRARPVCQFFLKTAERRLLFLIPILHQTTTRGRQQRKCARCSSFQFYIKPQRPPCDISRCARCFSFQFYIKPQQRRCSIRGASCCFSFQFYIKPQRMCAPYRQRKVVSHSNSTSNHNSTAARSRSQPLFLIPILHQTTTLAHGSNSYSARYTYDTDA
ncbi:putative uncharacterized protein [Alistipes sp. CAG:157]|nr:putative uncharacterized protein [Alistipes sp. CAG:157]